MRETKGKGEENCQILWEVMKIGEEEILPSRINRLDVNRVLESPSNLQNTCDKCGEKYILALRVCTGCKFKLCTGYLRGRMKIE